MKKIIIATILAATPLTVLAEGLKPSLTIGTERELEAEINSVYGSVGYGMASFGVTMKDTTADNMKFNISKYEVDFAQPVGNVTLYMKNDFDDGFKHSETVIGGKIKF